MGKEIIKITKRNYRGLTVGDLVCELQGLEDEFKDLCAVPNAFDLPMIFRDSEYNHDKYINEEKYAIYCQTQNIERELTRRRNLNQGDVSIKPDVLLAIKEKVKIEDIIEKYCETFFHKNTWTYRCSLHEDNHPSGHVYPETNTFCCFQCQTAGDVIDAQMKYGHMNFPSTLKYLSSLIGIEIIYNTKDISTKDICTLRNIYIGK